MSFPAFTTAGRARRSSPRPHRVHTSSSPRLGRTRRRATMSLLQDISQNVRNIRQLQFTALSEAAAKIQQDLNQGANRPYRHLINASYGDPHSGGLKPLTFVRQVLAACFYPQLLQQDALPADARRRAGWLLSCCAGGSVGSYTGTAGLSQVVRRISEFISRRDGGVPSHPDNIYISNGSQWSLAKVLSVLLDSEASPPAGVLTPVPGHVTTVMSVTGQGGVPVPYYLCEEQGWTLQVEELQRALEAAEGVCRPVALYVVNPGNPTGLVQSRKSMQEVIRFAAEKKLFLLADEVYQDFVYGEDGRFVSYKRALAEAGPPLSQEVQLASFHTASKSLMAECGLRGGYVELVNLDPAVMTFVHSFFSTDSCAAVTGQMALDLMAHPPRPGDPSYPLYLQETQDIRTTLVHNVKRVHEVLNRLPGFSCQPVGGGGYAFPRLDLPPRAVRRAQEAGIEPDTFYCMRLLEDAGVLAIPGSEFGQRDGTHHIRLSILTRADVLEELLGRLSSFQSRFLSEQS